MEPRHSGNSFAAEPHADLEQKRKRDNEEFESIHKDARDSNRGGRWAQKQSATRLARHDRTLRPATDPY
jgi:hypothetical protein